ncbi:MAG TPA: 2-phospho-L-lactate transferase [Actinomadura sp.]|jgi:LPPG:FO 2-phospho-L-lactate transferase|nr:2-phospho-L-lactate transferase [Actinomadura sp.]
MRMETSPAGKIVVLAGGIGGARFLRGLQRAAPEAEITVIGNTGDDISLFGLRVCPDLDTVMYTLGGGINEEQGWGRADESFTVKEELAAYGVGPGWFGLGDRDFGTHIVRTQMLDAGYPLSAVTEALCERWLGPAAGRRVRLIPMTDDRVETHVVISDSAGRRAVHFQEWWVRLRASVPAESITPVGADNAKPAPGVLDAIAEADIVILPPSNPVVSVGTILSVPGIRSAVEAKTVVGISPIIGGAPVRGMADACLSAIGVETSARAVAAHYGSDLLDGWLVDTADAAIATDAHADAGPAADAGSDPAGGAAGQSLTGITVRSRPLLMTDVDATAEIARAALDLAADLR